MDAAELAKELVRLSRIRGSVGPVLISAKIELAEMEKTYKESKVKSRLYWEIKNMIPQLEKLISKANAEFEAVIQETLMQHKISVIAEYRAERRAAAKTRKLTETL